MIPKLSIYDAIKHLEKRSEDTPHFTIDELRGYHMAIEDLLALIELHETGVDENDI